MINRKIFPGLALLLCFQLASWSEGAVASPIGIPFEPVIPSTELELPAEASFQEQFFNYVYEQKYTLLLGEDRSSCAYYIDPTDVYEQGQIRFVTTILTRGSGTACRGVLLHKILQADCESNILYTIERSGEGDPRFQGWERFERRLSVANHGFEIETSLDETEQNPAAQICALPLLRGTEAPTPVR